jgi:hypothetical protein
VKKRHLYARHIYSMAFAQAHRFEAMHCLPYFDDLKLPARATATIAETEAKNRLVFGGIPESPSRRRSAAPID